MSLLFGVASRAAASSPFEISGRAWRGQAGFDVAVHLRNVSRSRFGPLSVEAELMGCVEYIAVETGLAPGATRTLHIRCPTNPPRPGVYPLVLHIQHSHNGVRVGRRGYLLLALGADTMPALRVSVAEVAVRWQAVATVELSSLDRQPHRALLRALTGLGTAVVAERRVVEVPATGSVRVPVRVLYAGAPRATKQGLLVLASAEDGVVERTSVATADVQVQDGASWLPRLRWPLAGIGFALIACVVACEMNAFARCLFYS